MDRRTFIKDLGLKTAGLTAGISALNAACRLPSNLIPKPKNWVWITQDSNATNDQWKERFEILKKSGFHAVLPEVLTGTHALYANTRLESRDTWLERLIPIAKEYDLEIHTWMHCMPHRVQSVIDNHPDWYNVNRLGQSSLTHPAYVNYYKFLCPSKEEVHAHLAKNVEELAQYDVDGVHFDYIRYPDVIIARGLWERYNIVQDQEYAEYDYCYCSTCREKFKKQTGIDPMKIEDPANHQEWVQFRYDQVTNLVNNVMIPAAKKYNKVTTAAVFPNWQAVRQQWHVWKLDAAFPMLYNRYYLEDAEWIKRECKTGLKLLKHHKNLYSGLMVDEPEKLREYVTKSFEGGAKGISIFSLRALRPAHYEILQELLREA